MTTFFHLINAFKIRISSAKSNYILKSKFKLYVITNYYKLTSFIIYELVRLWGYELVLSTAILDRWVCHEFKKKAVIAWKF